MKFDDLLVEIGEFGFYQKVIFSLSCLPFITAGIQTLIVVFTLAIPDYRCAIPGYKNDTYHIENNYQYELINYSLPWQMNNLENNQQTSKWGDAQCYVFKGRTAQNFNGTIPTTNASEVGCNNWVYEKDTFDNTFATDVDIVCENEILRDHATMVFMCGQMVGSIIFGFISDKYGRKVSIMGTLLVQLITSVSLAFVNNYYAFIAIRFFTATGTVGALIVGFVLALEIVGPKYRAQAGVATQLFWVFGEIALAGVAYAIRDWRNLQLVLGCHIVLYFVLYWAIPESPRWQVSQGRLEEAKVTMEKVAKSNGTKLPENAFEGEIRDDASEQKGHFGDIFKSSTLVIRLLVIVFNWMVVAMMYYGLTLNVNTLGGSVYIDYLVSVVVEVPANVACLFALPVFGRKNYHCFSMLLGGVACLAAMAPSLAGTTAPLWVNLLLSNIGKFGVTGGFSVVFIFSAEMFPTYMSNSVMGASSMGARIGTIAAPYIGDLGRLVGGRFGPALPLIVFGIASILAGLSSFLLPETLNKQIPETIEDAIELSKGKRSGYTDMGGNNEEFDGGSINNGYGATTNSRYSL